MGRSKNARASAKSAKAAKAAKKTRPSTPGFEKLVTVRRDMENAGDLAGMAQVLQHHADMLKEFDKAGVTGDYCAAREDCIWFYTHDAAIADKYKFHRAAACHCTGCGGAGCH